MLFASWKYQVHSQTVSQMTPFVIKLEFEWLIIRNSSKEMLMKFVDAQVISLAWTMVPSTLLKIGIPNKQLKKTYLLTRVCFTIGVLLNKSVSNNNKFIYFIRSLVPYRCRRFLYLDLAATVVRTFLHLPHPQLIAAMTFFSHVVLSFKLIFLVRKFRKSLVQHSHHVSKSENLEFWILGTRDLRQFQMF